jgi:hypothetical protein
MGVFEPDVVTCSDELMMSSPVIPDGVMLPVNATAFSIFCGQVVGDGSEPDGPKTKVPARQCTASAN